MPRRARNYAAEYARRIARGVERGFSKAQAAGHPKRGEPSIREFEKYGEIKEGVITWPLLRTAGGGGRIAETTIRTAGSQNEVMLEYWSAVRDLFLKDDTQPLNTLRWSHVDDVNGRSHKLIKNPEILNRFRLSMIQEGEWDDFLDRLYKAILKALDLWKEQREQMSELEKSWAKRQAVASRAQTRARKKASK